MPSTSRCGVDSALPKVSAPVLSSNTAMSVKVPPMSAARRITARDLGRREGVLPLRGLAGARRFFGDFIGREPDSLSLAGFLY